MCIGSSRVQITQAVDGGVLAELNVKEGDQVAEEQVLARLNQTRFVLLWKRLKHD